MCVCVCVCVESACVCVGMCACICVWNRERTSLCKWRFECVSTKKCTFTSMPKHACVSKCQNTEHVSCDLLFGAGVGQGWGKGHTATAASQLCSYLLQPVPVWCWRRLHTRAAWLSACSSHPSLGVGGMPPFSLEIHSLYRTGVQPSTNINCPNCWES